MKILITGGAGYIGSILVSKLIAANAQARYSLGVNKETTEYNEGSHELMFDKLMVYDNLMYKQVCLTEHLYADHFEFIHGDVRDHQKLLPYIKEADIIIPLAAIVGFPACNKDPKLAYEVNFEQIKFILDNTTSSQCILFPNTNSGYGVGHGDILCTEDMPLEPISVYGSTKCNAEQLLLDSGRAITLRLATVFGVSTRMRLDLLINDFVYKAMHDGYIVLFEKDFKRNFIHIRDVALTFIYMINRYDNYVGNSFNVGLTNANLSKLELANEIKKFIPNFSIQLDDFFQDPDKRNYIVITFLIKQTNHQGTRLNISLIAYSIIPLVFQKSV